MKKITLCCFAVFLMSASLKLMAQDEAAMKNWVSYMTPGDVHKMLATANGEWKEDITMWMAPGAPPMKSVGTVVNKMIMGGRYQQSMYTGDFNGMPFEGMSLLGYDNVKKVFMNSWIDNMGTGIMQLEGTWDDKTKTINFTGHAIDAATGLDMKIRQTLKMIDNNTQLMEMFSIADNAESKTLEIKFTRK